MPKIGKGGVSNQMVDPDFIAEPGVPVEKAVDEGLPDVGKAENDKAETEKSTDKGADIQPDKKTDDNRVTAAQEPEKPDTPVDGPAPAKTAAPRKAQGRKI